MISPMNGGQRTLSFESVVSQPCLFDIKGTLPKTESEKMAQNNNSSIVDVLREKLAPQT